MTPIQLTLRALLELTEGRDVILVAEDHQRAVEIAKGVCRLAKRLGIGCSNLIGADPDLPRIGVRGYRETPQKRRFDRPTSVLFAKSFSRMGEWAGVGRCRLIVTAESGRVPEQVDSARTTGLP